VEAPKKSLGQHWLHDRAILQAMCDAADITSDDTVLEIGPGLGTLTAELVQRAREVIAVEYDAILASSLPTRVRAKNLTIISGDILEFDLLTLPKGYKVAANVPYYITSKIVRLLLESPNPPQTIALLVQKEVAERLAADAGSMSILAVSAQFYADVSLGHIVPAELFTPPPQVDSQIVRLRYTGPKFTDINPNDFFRVVRAGFSERRKKLRSSLSGGLQLPKNVVDELLRTANIPTEARAQELDLDQWHQLTVSWLILTPKQNNAL
jgi:16S rRNA (adenine1518-N6/adenine1519-N6)-dimethyltransferase